MQAMVQLYPLALSVIESHGDKNGMVIAYS
jgi:hypothetical protein